VELAAVSRCAGNSRIYMQRASGGLEGGDARAGVGIAPVHRHGVECRHPLITGTGWRDLLNASQYLISEGLLALLGKADAGDADYQPVTR